MTKKVIIIDDSATQLNILKSTFANDNWDVCGVQNAKIGYEMIFDFAPDLVVTDALMPQMGGFQFVKLIRENEKISKIPVIVYSVLSESNAKFYLREELSEYFLKKDNNYSELLELANSLVKKFPLDKNYKDDILRVGLQNYKESVITEENVEEIQENSEENQENEIISEEQNIDIVEQNIFDIDKFASKIRNCANFKYSDEKIIKELFPILHFDLDYDLAVVNLHSFDEKENKVYFDIKDVILSPIFKEYILNKFGAKTNIMYKKYAPNLDVIVQENEFLSKLEFNFKYKNDDIGNIIFYSKKKLKWDSNENIDEIQNVLYEFFKLRFIARNTENNKKNSLASRYFPFNKFKNIKNEQDIYFGIIQITNYLELKTNLSQEEMDVINSKISEKIINYFEEDEQIYRNYEDEYDIVIFAKDKKQLMQRLNFIANEINLISDDENKIETFIIATSCMIENVFNIIEAQKIAKEALDLDYEEEKVVIL